MKTKYLNISILLVLVVALTCSCQNKRSREISNFLFSESENLPRNLQEEDIIFYNIFTPNDMSKMPTKFTSLFNGDLLNSAEKVSNYDQSSTMALNIGVYGADLNYLWLFGEQQKASSYLAAIHMLCDQMNIPSEFISLTAETAERYASNIDTLKHIARETYSHINNNLIENGRSNNAALMLLGGWIESLYLALNMYDRPDEKMISRIATQQFSLGIIVNKLKNEQDNIDVAAYLILLKRLNKAFNDFKIQVPQNCMEIDSINRRIIIKDIKGTKINTQQIDKIRSLTNNIRTMIIE